jgi:hypothetical protein
MTGASTAQNRTAHADVRRLLDDAADDAAVCSAFARLQVSYSMYNNAAGLLAVAAAICHRRPHLASRVLARPVDVLVAMGCTDTARAFKWVDHLLRHPYPQFAETAGPGGIEWLTTKFPTLSDIVAGFVAESVEWYRAHAANPTEPGASPDHSA